MLVKNWVHLQQPAAPGIARALGALVTRPVRVVGVPIRAAGRVIGWVFGWKRYLLNKIGSY